MTLKLDTLMDASMKLPLVSERHPKAEKVIYPDWDSNPWHRLSEEIWGDIKQMVRIERMDKPEPPLLTPEQHFFLRENLKLRLLTARIALLQRDEAAYRSDLNMAQAWLTEHYDSHDANVQNALSTLRQLSASGIIIQIPDISESLNSVRKYKAGLERTTP
jgi:uroporphyrin-3 C-methyltransferase